MSQNNDRLLLNVRDVAVLTTSYIASNVANPNDSSVLFDCSKFDVFNLYLTFTKGSLTTAEVKIEFSADGTNWYQETNSLVSAGTEALTVNEKQLSAKGAYMVKGTINNRYLRVSAKGTGTVTGSSLGIKLELATR